MPFCPLPKPMGPKAWSCVRAKRPRPLSMRVQDKAKTLERELRFATSPTGSAIQRVGFQFLRALKVRAATTEVEHLYHPPDQLHKVSPWCTTQPIIDRISALSAPMVYRISYPERVVVVPSTWWAGSWGKPRVYLSGLWAPHRHHIPLRKWGCICRGD